MLEISDLRVCSVKIIVVLDRQEGARENIEAAGFKFGSLFTKTELGIKE